MKKKSFERRHVMKNTAGHHVPGGLTFSVLVY